jgi:TatD DNase family protein
VIDSHTHLGSCAEPDAELVAAARAVGVTRILTVGTDERSNRDALAAAAAFPDTVRAALGRHPNAATGFDDAALDDLRALAADPACVAIGETGLDHYRDHAPRDQQRRAFDAQIGLARELRKPLVVHTRAADDDTISVLRERAAGLDVILHCFSMADRVEECAAEGWWCSFAGNVTYPSAKQLAWAVTRVPENRLLVETDAPYLTPQSRRKHRNQPAFVVETAELVAEARGIPYGELERVVEANAQALFRW